jgi:hypothetical protein
MNIYMNYMHGDFTSNRHCYSLNDLIVCIYLAYAFIQSDLQSCVAPIGIRPYDPGGARAVLYQLSPKIILAE